MRDESFLNKVKIIADNIRATTQRGVFCKKNTTHSHLHEDNRRGNCDAVKKHAEYEKIVLNERKEVKLRKK